MIRIKQQCGRLCFRRFKGFCFCIEANSEVSKKRGKNGKKKGEKIMRNSTGSIRVERIPEPGPGPMGRFDLVTLSIGTVLGTGLLTYLPTGIAMMGTSAIWGFPFAVILGMLYLLPVTISASCLRMSGGLMSLVGDTTTPVMAGLYGMGNSLSAVALSMYGITFASYAAAIWPDLPRTLVAMIILTLFYAINLLGIKTMSKLQNVMFVVLLCGLALFIIIGIPHISQPIFDFSNPHFMPNDFATTFAGLMVLYGCCASFQVVSCQGRLAKNATKDLPFALLFTSAFIFVLYFLCAIVAAGVLPYEEISSAGTLAAVLKVIFPNWLYVIWMIAIPGLLVFTTLNGLFSTFSEQLAQCARDGWLPVSWSKENKRGATWVPLTIIYIVAAMFTLTGLSPSQIILATNILNIVFDVILFVAMLELPKKHPEAWARAKMHVPYGLWVVLNIVRVIIRGLAAYSAVVTLSTRTVIICVVLVAVAIVWCLYRAKSSETVIRIAVWEPHEDQ